MHKLTAREVPIVKASILSKRQGGVCPLCHKKLTVETGALDHDHDTGTVRGVLCKACNGAEGKIKNIVLRWGKGTNLILFLRRLADYLEHYRNNPLPVVYPTHRSVEEKRLLVNKRARVKRAKTKAAKKET